MPSPSLVVSCTLIRRVPLRCGRHQPEGRGGLHRGSMVTAPGLKPFRLQWVCRGCMTGLRNQRTSFSEAERRSEVRLYAADPLVEQAEASAVPRVHVFAPLDTFHLLIEARRPSLQTAGPSRNSFRRRPHKPPAALPFPDQTSRRFQASHVCSPYASLVAGAAFRSRPSVRPRHYLPECRLPTAPRCGAGCVPIG